VEMAAVADVGALQRSPFHRPLMALLQGVVGDRREARLGQCLAYLTADEARAAGDQYTSTHAATPDMRGAARVAAASRYIASSAAPTLSQRYSWSTVAR